MRSVALAAGALIVAATAHVSIMASGGYTSQGAPLQIAVALGLVVGAICVGMAWRKNRRPVAICLVLALLAGETFAIIMTAERIVTSREIAQAPVRDANELRAKATQRVADAKAAVSTTPATSPRLAATMAAKATADAAAIAKSAERGCAANCRSLLQAQVDAAQADVSAARSELEMQRKGARAELDAARVALAGLKPPPSATPLADRLGMAAWALDLLTAALASIAANGLGAALVAFGSHGPMARKLMAARAEPAIDLSAPQVRERKALPAPAARDHAARFALESLAPANATTPIVLLHGAYLDWCERSGIAPLAAREIGSALDDLFQRTGLVVTKVGGAPHLIGAKLKAARALSDNAAATPNRRGRAIGNMVTIGCAEAG